jgi:hypothetical protein
MDNIIESYLIEIGWKLDDASFDKAGKDISAKVEKKVSWLRKLFEALMDGIKGNKVVRGFLQKGDALVDKWATKIVTFLTQTKNLVAVAIGVIITAVAVLATFVVSKFAQFLSGMAKADIEVQKFARRMLTTVENARSLKAVMDQMGIKDIDELKDIALNPELRQQFLELRKTAEALRLNADTRDGFKNIRALEFEFQKTGLIWGYFWNQLAGDIGKFLSGPLSDLKSGLAFINTMLEKHLPRLAYDVAEVVGIFGKLGDILVKIGMLANPLIQMFLLFGNMDAKNFTVLDVFETLLDVINAILGGLNKLLNFGFDGGKISFGGGGDVYHEGGAALKTLADYTRKIYDFLTTVWNYLSGLVRNIPGQVGHVAGAAGRGALNFIPGGNALNSAIDMLNGGRASFSHGVKTSETIDRFLNGLDRIFRGAYTVTSGVASRSGGSLHPLGRAVDLVPHDHSIAGWANLVRNMLATPGLQRVNLELLPAHYSNVLRELDRQKVDYRGRISHQITRDWTGEHAHASLAPVTQHVQIQIHDARDPEKTARAVRKELQQVAALSTRANQGWA